MSTASSSVGKEGLSSSTGDTGSLDQKVEMAQKFDKEMKDYAKATVKEFLGIYGYEEDVDMEESAAEGSAQSERTMSINSASCTAVTPDNSRPPHEVTSNISSDCARDDVEEDNPASILAYQSSGPISFAVVSACASPSGSATNSSETIVSVHGKPPLKSKACHPRTSAARTHRRSGSLTPEGAQTECNSGEPLSEKTSRSDGSTLDPGSVVFTSASVGISSASVDMLSGSSRFTHVASRSRRDVGSAAQSTDSSSEMDVSKDDLSEDSSKVLLQEKNRLRMRIQRCSESTDKRELRLQQNRERARQRRANEDDEHRALRLVKDRERQKQKRTHEVEAERAKRLLQQRMSARRRRFQESPEQKEARKLRDKERTRRYREARRASHGTNQNTDLSTGSPLQDTNDTPTGSGTQDNVDFSCQQGLPSTPSGSLTESIPHTNNSSNKPAKKGRASDSQKEAALRNTSSSLAKSSVQDDTGSVTEPVIRDTSCSLTKPELDCIGSLVEPTAQDASSFPKTNLMEVTSNLPAKAPSLDTSGSPIQVTGTTGSSPNEPLVRVTTPLQLTRQATQDTSDTPSESNVKTTSGSPSQLPEQDVSGNQTEAVPLTETNTLTTQTSEQGVSGPLIMLATQAISSSLFEPIQSSCSSSREPAVQGIDCSPLKDVTRDSTSLPVVLSVQDESGSPLLMALHPSSTVPDHQAGNYQPFRLAIQNNSNSTIEPCVVASGQPLVLAISPASCSLNEPAATAIGISTSDPSTVGGNNNDVKVSEGQNELRDHHLRK